MPFSAKGWEMRHNRTRSELCIEHHAVCTTERRSTADCGGAVIPLIDHGARIPFPLVRIPRVRCRASNTRPEGSPDRHAGANENTRG